MNRILYIGSGGFPFGNARSLRMRSFCKLFADLGYEIDVVSDWNSSNGVPGIWRCLTKRNRDEYLGSNHLTRFQRYYAEVARALGNESYCFAFVTEMPERVHKIQQLCRSRGVPMIGDSCEWYDSSTWKYGVLDPHNLAFQVAHRAWYTRWDAVVSISTLLDGYYNNHDVPSIVVPTILDVKQTSFRCDSDASSRDINLLFAGSFGGSKDTVAPMVEAATVFSEGHSARKMVINILGPTKEEVKKALGNELYVRGIESGVLIIHGRVSQEHVADYWLKADYGLFLRPNRRSSNAGFPTKLGEGMAVGTPFITNRTGDIPLYIKNATDGILLDSCTKEECLAVVESLISMSDSEHSTMRASARRCAERSFDYRLYKENMASLVRGL